MSTRVIPVTSATSAYSQVVSLDGEDYTFVFRWNQRSLHWFVTIRDSAGDDLATGRKLTVNMPLGAHETIDGFPPGVIWTLDLGTTEDDPRLRDLGDRVVMMYVDEDNVS